ncbi:MAG: Cna B-type domain-containing protein, partial [Oscillospiraceae bacterium]|nr:Cna B-type domain-containing protein [Oscillospiraceae bacterium]
MTIKKSFLLRAVSLIVAFALTFITVMIFPTNMVAYGEEDGTTRELSDNEVTLAQMELVINGSSDPEPVSQDQSNPTKIRDGDKLKFNFTWRVEGALTEETTFVFDLNKLGYFDFNIDNNLGYYPSKDGKPACTYKIENNKLFITVHIENDEQKEMSGHGGDCSFSGIFDLGGKNIENPESLDIPLDDGTYYLDVSDLIPKPYLEVTKESVEQTAKAETMGDRDQIYEENGSYYIDYIITVTSRNGMSENVMLSDTEWNGISQFGEVVEVEPGNLDSDGKLSLGNIKEGETKTVRYKVKLNQPTRNLIIEHGKYNNSITATSDNGDPGSDSDSVDVTADDPPRVEKDGVQNGNEITWTIRIYPGYLGQNADFTLKDDFVDIEKVIADNFSKIFVNGQTISRSELGDKIRWDENEQCYKIEYTTEINGDILAQTSYEITNNVTAVFKDGITRTNGDTVSKDGNIGVTKRVFDRSGNDITWEIEIEVPELSREIASFDISDYFTFTSDAVNFDANAIEITISDKSGNEQSIPIDKVRFKSVTDHWRWELTIDDTVVNFENYKGGKINVKFKSTVNVDGLITGLKNTASATLNFKNGDTSISGEDFEDVDDKPVGGYEACKVAKPNVYEYTKANGTYTVQWFVGVSYPKNDEINDPGCVKIGDTIKIVDTIPDNHRLLKDKVKICPLNIGGNAIYETWPTDDYEYTIDTNDEKTYTFIFTITNANNINNYITYHGNAFGVLYTTEMDEAEYQRLVKEGVNKTYTNTADVSVKPNGEKTFSPAGTVSASYEAVPSDLIKKTGSFDKDRNDHQIKYTIEINPHSAQLSLSTDGKIKAVDTLGQNLKLNKDSISIMQESADGSYVSGEGCSVEYDNDDDPHIITFILNDETHYKITYTVDVEFIYKEDKENANGTWVNNTISISALGAKNYSDGTDFNWGEFYKDFSYNTDPDNPNPDEDDNIEIEVTKVWKDDTDHTDAREEVTVKLLNANNAQVGDTLTLNEENNWTDKWTDIPKDDYHVAEVTELDDYTSEVSDLEYDEENEKYTCTVTNTYKVPDPDPDPDKTRIQLRKTDIDGSTELAGAELRITKQDDDTFEEITWTSKINDPWVFELEDGTYTLTEDLAPLGYGIITRFDFTVDNGTVTSSSATISTESGVPTITVMDSPIEFSIQKVDFTNGSKEIGGAHLELYSGTQCIDYWDSVAGTPHVIDLSKLIADNKTITRNSDGTYTFVLKETSAPKGYEKLDTEFTFTVDKYGKVVSKSETYLEAGTDNLVKLKNKALTTVKIKKTDISGIKELAGAKLTIKKTNDSTFEAKTWTSKINDPWEIELANGIYTLTEDLAPLGYKVITEFEFTVNNGTVASLSPSVSINTDTGVPVLTVMDSPIKFSIRKTDIGGKKELNGAKLELY